MIVASIAALTLLVLGFWAREAFAAYLEHTAPHPIRVETFEALQSRVEDIDRRSVRTETKLNAQGFRNG